MLYSINYLPKALWNKADFYEIFPLDGGGCFSTLDLAGGIRDQGVADAVVDGTLFAPFRNAAGDVDWEQYDRWDCIEKGVWLNRWYWLAAPARIYWLTREARYARAVINWINVWRTAVEKPADYETYYRTFQEGFSAGHRRIGDRACSTWCDFQLAQRLIVGYWVNEFLRDADIWNPADRDTFRDMMIDHARLLYRADREGGFEPGNHQVVRAFALLHAAVLLGDLEESARWWERGEAMMIEHGAKDFTDEGLGREGSYSYLLFQLSQYAHAAALARASGRSVPDPWIDLTRKMTAFLSATATPAGTTPVVNDGYEAELAPVFNVCRALVGDLEETGQNLQSHPVSLRNYAQGGCAVMEMWAGSTRFWALVDAMPPYGNSGHWHAGKPTVQVWVRDQPLLGECGCPNYDDPLYGQWFRRGPAHFAVTVDGQEDAQFISEVRWDHPPEIHLTQKIETAAQVRMAYESNGFQRLADPVSYLRRVEMEAGGALTVTDVLRSSGGRPHRFQVHIPFLTREVRLTGERSAEAVVGGIPVRVQWNLGQVTLSNRPVSIGSRQGEYPHLTIELPDAAGAEFIVRIQV